MRYAGLLVLMLAAGCAADAVDEEASETETEQAVWDGSGEAEGETVLVQGGLDPCWAGLCWPSNWPTDSGPGYSGDGPGGGAGGHGTGPDGGPGPQPNRKECFPTTPDEICLDCCLYNYDQVDGWKCRKHKEGSRGWRNCWEKAAERLADCQTNDCDRHGPRPIPTIRAWP